MFTGALAAGLSLAACSSTSEAPHPSGVASTRTTAVSTTGAVTASTVTTLPTSLHVGSTAEVTNEGIYTADVTLLQVLDNPSVVSTPPELGYGQPVDPSSNRKFVALQFTVVNVGTDQIDDLEQNHEANLEAWVATSNDQEFDPVRAMAPGCPRLFKLVLDSGHKATVCEVFQVPASAFVAYAQVAMASGVTTGNSVASWRIP